MTVGGLMSKAPNWVLAVCATVVFLAIITAATVLSLAGKSTDSLLTMVTLLLNVLAGVGGVAGIGSFIASSAAAKSAGAVEDKIVNDDQAAH